MDFAAFVRALARRRQGRATGSRATALVAVRRIRSTHLLGRRVAEEYGRESLVPPSAEIVAWEQTGGVGRDGRSWSSPAGKGAYLSLIRPLDSRQRIQRLPLAIAVAVCEAVDRRLGGGRPCRLKWPNDLEVAGRKLGGILIDVISPAVGRPGSSAAARRPAAVAVAILSLGVNVSRELQSFDAPRATSLEAESSASAPPPSLDALVVELAEAVDAALAGEGSGAPDEGLITRYQRLSRHRPGDEIRCRLDGGSLTGTFLGFDAHGFLRLEVGGEVQLISSGVVDSG